MNIVFLKTGEYKNDDRNVIITAENVEKEKMFSVVEKNAIPYVKKGIAKLAEEIRADEHGADEDFGIDLNKMTVTQLEEYADDCVPLIDLSEAKNKAEKLEVIKAELEAREKAINGE